MKSRKGSRTARRYQKTETEVLLREKKEGVLTTKTVRGRTERRIEKGGEANYYDEELEERVCARLTGVGDERAEKDPSGVKIRRGGT